MSSSESPKPTSRGTPLSARETDVVTAQLASLVGSGLPLAAGLRATAAEAPTRRVSNALTDLAALLEQGRPVDEALAQLRWRVPAYLRRLLTPLQNSVSRDQLLEEWNQQRRALDDAAGAVRRALAYPAALLFLAGLVLTAVPALVGETFGRMFQEFDIKLKFPSQLMVALGGPTGTVLFLAVFFAPLALWLVRTMVGRGWWRTTWSRLPLAGSLWRWIALAEWSRTVALLLDAGSPLPEALELAADDEQDQRVARGSRQLAEAVNQGNSLSQAIADQSFWPASVAVLVRHGEQANQLAMALRSAAEIYESRVRMRSRWLQSILPTFVFLLVGYGVFAAFFSLLLPMFDFLEMFSFPPPGGATRSTPSGYLLAPLSIVGVAVLIATGLVYGPSRALSRGFLHRVLVSSGVFLLLAGILGLATSLGILFAIVFAVMLAIGLVESITSYRRCERQAILVHIAVAVERGLPLSTALRAHGLETTGPLGWLGEGVAQRLAEGCDLPEALRRSGVRLTVGQSVAVGMGWDLGCLPEAVHEAVRSENDMRLALRALGDKLTYVGSLLLLWIGTFAFLTLRLRLIATFRKMYDEFALDLPVLTTWVFDLVEGGQIWMIAAVILVTPVALFIAIGAGLGILDWLIDLPLVGRLSLRSDGGWVLRGVAWSLRRGLSITQGLAHLEKRFPKRRVRQRLETARQIAEAGGAWPEALRSVGLLRAADVGLLEAAQRVGNLPWALSESADSTQRRAVYRLRQLGTNVFPFVLIGLGGMLGAVAIGMMWPLIDLIANLS